MPKTIIKKTKPTTDKKANSQKSDQVDLLKQLKDLEVVLAKASLARSTGKQKNTKLSLIRDKIARLKLALANTGLKV